MNFIRLQENNPYFNLAVEEFLLKNSNQDFFLLYINNPSIIIGKHQNLFAEINPDFVEEKQILLSRRISGGGTVYHDLGNLNFSFIVNGTEGHLAGQKKFTHLIVNALNHMKVPAIAGKRNEILLNEKKVSGCAEHIFKNRVLHHGTLLFSSDLDTLTQSIKVKDGYSGKAVQSIRSEVANIQPYLPAFSIEEFKTNMLVYFSGQNLIQNENVLSAEYHKEIEMLVTSKYQTWEWISGYSPEYSIERTVVLDKGELKITADIEKGKFKNIKLESNAYSYSILGKMEALILGKMVGYDLKNSLHELSFKIDVERFVKALL